MTNDSTDQMIPNQLHFSRKLGSQDLFHETISIAIIN